MSIFLANFLSQHLCHYLCSTFNFYFVVICAHFLSLFSAARVPSLFSGLHHFNLLHASNTSLSVEEILEFGAVFARVLPTADNGPLHPLTLVCPPPFRD